MKSSVILSCLVTVTLIHIILAVVLCHHVAGHFYQQLKLNVFKEPFFVLNVIIE